MMCKLLWLMCGSLLWVIYTLVQRIFMSIVFRDRIYIYKATHISPHIRRQSDTHTHAHSALDSRISWQRAVCVVCANLASRGGVTCNLDALFADNISQISKYVPDYVECILYMSCRHITKYIKNTENLGHSKSSSRGTYQLLTPRRSANADAVE